VTDRPPDEREDLQRELGVSRWRPLLAHRATRYGAVALAVGGLLVWRFGPLVRWARERDDAGRRIKELRERVDKATALAADAHRQAEEARAQMLRAHRRSVEATVPPSRLSGQTRQELEAWCMRAASEGCRWASYERSLDAESAEDFEASARLAVQGCEMGDAVSCWLAGDATEYGAQMHALAPDGAATPVDELRRNAVRHYQTACTRKFWFGCYSGVALVHHRLRTTDLESVALDMVERGCSLSVAACASFCKMGLAPACNRLTPEQRSNVRTDAG
jgi:hypothetical protein